MTATLPNLDQLKPNPHWARLPLFERKGRTTVHWGGVANIREVTREGAQSFLTADHIERIVKAYEKFKDEPGLARVASLEEIRAKDGNLSIPLYVTPGANNVSNANPASSGKPDLTGALSGWLESSRKVRDSLHNLLADT